MNPLFAKARGSLIEAHIADIHFGAIEPKNIYDILKKQFLDILYTLPILDIVSIDGDLFDRKLMANSDDIYYANLFIYQLVDICKMKNTSLILLSGTESHDQNQLKLYYPYLNDKDLDLYIVEHPQFITVKNKRILCIPEKYNLGRDFYINLLFKSGTYDACYMHGTIVSSIPTAKQANLSSEREPIFDINCFQLCKGPIICGHIHTPHIYKRHIYYCGSPIRYKFGEEETKGFLILIQNLDTSDYLIKQVPIDSYNYKTIVLDHNTDPKKTIDYINTLKDRYHVDKLRVVIKEHSVNDEFIKDHFRNSHTVKIQDDSSKEAIKLKQDEAINDLSEYSFLFDPKYDEFTKFCKYVNLKENAQIIDVDTLKNLLKDTM